MKISVKVITNSSQEKVEQTGENEYKVYVHAKPIKGEANKAVRKVLCEHFNLPKHKVALVGGKTAKIKTFEVRD